MSRIVSKWKGMFVAAAALGIFLAAPRTAHAGTITYYFNIDYCSSPCLGGTDGGTVTLTDNGGNVDVSVALNPVYFHDNTAAFETFAFNLDTTPTGVTNISGTAGSTWTYLTSGSPFHEDGAGYFGYALDCSNCNVSGAGNVADQTLSFTVDGVSISDFAVLSTDNKGNPLTIAENGSYFAADVTTAAGATVCTGIIGSNTTSPTTPVTTVNSGTGCSGGGGTNGQTPVPEPASLLLLGTGLAFASRRLRKR